MAQYEAQAITGLSDGATVSTWSDVSGSGNDAALAHGTVTYVANGYNGHPAVHFAA